ncbi:MULTISPECIES: LysE/ArgO family amino acid transporter [Ruegeria]|jgi:L-lysine exporter family protein LysE/ArgO|uniref:LysE family transporter n=1 Tax=Ruegeria atlantica TaxID=81569 RepID=A0AA90YW63_9RHOB|nr:MULTISPECIES: LysE/ArgO family amino acid transporter [Ruegeria]NOC43989.1 LysE family transporter [Ruegeria sp. HKCCD7559]NOD28720.1 LysE family transporter [Ruegeria atlantica]NOD98314.1 LysE family transporter [Ruegeria sp. HKCCD6228]NOE18183.1 LysE family transporter [Ruegeria atlantica]
MPTSVIAGFALGFSLILAIGAQNAFILRQGLRREHVFFLCLTCAVSDAILIGAGVAGFGTLAQAAPWFETVMRYGGAAFLTWYGLRSLRSSWLGGSVMEIGNGKRTSLKAALLTVFAFTWLNPHVYLDTVVLIGSISAQYDDRLGFALGAMTSSFVFFFSLGYGASILSPVFARPRAWQVLDAGIGVVMLGIALKLVTM